MLNRERIKEEMRHRGMDMAQWCRLRGLEYAALHRVFRGQASDAAEQAVCKALEADGLLFKESERAAEEVPDCPDWKNAVFWSFREASRYLGVKESKLRRWAASGTEGFPCAMRIGGSRNMMLSRRAVQSWAETVIQKMKG